MDVHPLRGKLRFVAQVALGGMALAVAAGLATIPNGGGQVVGVIAAVVVVVAAAWIIRGFRRQALVVDGNRLGWRRGLTERTSGWTDLDDVEDVTAAKLNSNVSLRHTDLVLWTRTGGMRSIDAVLLKWQLPAERRRRLDDRVGPGASDAPLHPFLVPLTALRPEAREQVVTLLEGHGLLQPPANSSA